MLDRRRDFAAVVRVAPVVRLARLAKHGWAGLLCAALAAAAQGQPKPQPQQLRADPTINFTVSPRDTLIGLSTTVLTSPAAWREVAALNRLPNANRIRPGQVLRIPTRLLRFEVLPARLTSLQGDVRLRSADGLESPATEGAAWLPGQTLRTGEGAGAVIELADGSRVQVAQRSEAALDEHRRYLTRSVPIQPNASEGLADETEGWFAGSMRLLQGGLDVLATKLGRAKPLEVHTPTAVIGVRGTQYRLRHDGEGPSALSRSEVLEGLVQADVRTEPQATAGTQPALGVSSSASLAAGFGAALQAGTAPTVRALLPAPDLSAVPALFERPIQRFTVPDAATPLRVQVAGDARFDRLVLDTVVAAGSEVRLTGLADGPWLLRARRIDDLGLEGLDARHAFTLKARPEPPATLQPRPGSKLPVGPVTLAWAQSVEAQSYLLQVARDPAFGADAPIEAVTDARRTVPLDSAGDVFWRVASVRADGDRGPWGDAQRFELRPLPEPPDGGLAADGQSLQFTWGARAQDQQQVELARDAQFVDLVARADLTDGSWTLPKPDHGWVFFRYRSVEPDGFVSPWSTTLRVEVPRVWRPRWLFLPLLGPNAP